MRTTGIKSLPTRLFAAFLAILLFAGAAGLISAISGKSITERAVLAAEDTYSLSAGGSASSASATGPEGSVAVQFNVAAAFRSVSLVMSGSGSGKTATMKLYKWDQNVIDSVKGTVLAEKEISEWNSGDEVVLESAQEAGEYVIELKLKGDVASKTKAAIKTEKKSRRGVQVYQEYYNTKNVAPAGTIVLAEAGDDPFRVVSTNKNYPFKQAAPAYEYPEDSAVVQLGIDPTQWSAVDGLGRTLPGNAEVGDKNDKVVGIFYWTWHQGNMQSKAVNINNLMLEYPELVHDYKNKLWAKNTVGSYFWNEPIYGYYTELDDYVLCKHAELLADAGVDFVLFDCTNGDLTWESAYLNLLKVWGEAREQGIRTPQIAFMMQFWWDDSNTPSSVKQVYNAIYKDGKYQDQWFYWEGKPLIMCQYSGFSQANLYDAELLNFFTWRRGEPSYFNGDSDDTKWGWLHIYPQALYKNSDGTVEMTTVGVCMNADWSTMSLSAQNGDHNMGRSYTRQKDFSYSYEYRGRTVNVDSNIANSSFYGLNFQEQWDYAISVDPEIIFITGWNEWIMGRFETWCGVANAFPDQYNDENSRDVEPSKGALKDYYYYQMVANIRRFKGASKITTQEAAKTIDINAGKDQWNDAGIITYNHYTKNTYERNIKTWGVKYTGDAIRNDFRTAKVSFDADNIYFYIETVDDITASSDANWMMLLLDTMAATADSKDWEEFEYIINRTSPSGQTLSVEKSTGGWNWEKTGDASYTVSGNVMQLSVPRSALGLDDATKPLSFGFKWCDNNLTDGDIMTIYTEGDAAPGGRFTFAFSSEAVQDSEQDNGNQNSDNGSKDNNSDVDGGNNTLMIVLMVLCIVAALAAVAAVIVVTRKKKG
ncbi:MAG: hypothetical protein J5950_06730 [Clostridia bacterium]|nr:hypothetical protein [Clostridia bacterium]